MRNSLYYPDVANVMLLYFLNYSVTTLHCHLMHCRALQCYASCTFCASQPLTVQECISQCSNCGCLGPLSHFPSAVTAIRLRTAELGCCSLHSEIAHNYCYILRLGLVWFYILKCYTLSYFRSMAIAIRPKHVQEFLFPNISQWECLVFLFPNSGKAFWGFPFPKQRESFFGIPVPAPKTGTNYIILNF